MSKHHLVLNLIGTCKQQQHLHRTHRSINSHRIGSQNVYSQQQIALDTYAILEQSCLQLSRS